MINVSGFRPIIIVLVFLLDSLFIAYTHSMEEQDPFLPFSSSQKSEQITLADTRELFENSTRWQVLQMANINEITNNVHLLEGVHFAILADNQEHLKFWINTYQLPIDWNTLIIDGDMLNCSLLGLAIRYGTVNSVRLILEFGHPINNIFHFQHNANLEYPILRSAGWGQNEIFSLLIEMGADTQMIDGPFTPYEITKINSQPKKRVILETLRDNHLEIANILDRLQEIQSTQGASSLNDCQSLCPMLGSLGVVASCNGGTSLMNYILLNYLGEDLHLLASLSKSDRKEALILMVRVVDQLLKAHPSINLLKIRNILNVNDMDTLYLGLYRWLVVSANQNQLEDKLLLLKSLSNRE